VVQIATLTITLAVTTEAGAQLRSRASRRGRCALNKVASALPDKSATGASTVLTIDNGVGSTCGLQITAGPYSGSQVLC
jgi:hypothetical protein